MYFYLSYRGKYSLIYAEVISYLQSSSGQLKGMSLLMIFSLEYYEMQILWNMWPQPRQHRSVDKISTRQMVHSTPKFSGTISSGLISSGKYRYDKYELFRASSVT